MIDSHCHLADPKFTGDLDAVMAHAQSAGVTSMVTIGDTLAESGMCVTIAEKFENIFCAIGVHPHHAKDWRGGDDEKLRILAASSKKVKAIGEIGLDYHYDFSPRDVQKEVFQSQLFLAS